ncbi:hypothetical protein G6F68_009985 [Rhizopus microsporus]|nr:hypothetical protein G6F68_009985 [Rhizopus microsporus]
MAALILGRGLACEGRRYHRIERPIVRRQVNGVVDGVTLCVAVLGVALHQLWNGQAHTNCRQAGSRNGTRHRRIAAQLNAHTDLVLHRWEARDGAVGVLDRHLVQVDRLVARDQATDLALTDQVEHARERTRSQGVRTFDRLPRLALSLLGANQVQVARLGRDAATDDCRADQHSFGVVAAVCQRHGAASGLRVHGAVHAVVRGVVGLFLAAQRLRRRRQHLRHAAERQGHADVCCCRPRCQREAGSANAHEGGHAPQHAADDGLQRAALGAHQHRGDLDHFLARRVEQLILSDVLAADEDRKPNPFALSLKQVLLEAVEQHAERAHGLGSIGHCQAVLTTEALAQCSVEPDLAQAVSHGVPHGAARCSGCALPTYRRRRPSQTADRTGGAASGRRPGRRQRGSEPANGPASGSCRRGAGCHRSVRSLRRAGGPGCRGPGRCPTSCRRARTG